MYQTHQRITSNPRSYTPPDPNVSGSDARRDESSGQVYAGGEGYAYQPGAGFAPVSDIGYGYG